MVMKPRLLPGFCPSWKSAVEWMGFQPYNTTVAYYYFLEHPHGNDQGLGTKAVSWFYNNYSIHSENPAFYSQWANASDVRGSKTASPTWFLSRLVSIMKCAQWAEKTGSPLAWQPGPSWWRPLRARALQPGHHRPDPGQPPRFQPRGDAYWDMEQIIHTLHSRAVLLMQHLSLLSPSWLRFESKRRSPNALTYCVALKFSRVTELGVKGAQYLAGLAP